MSLVQHMVEECPNSNSTIHWTPVPSTQEWCVKCIRQLERDPQHHCQRAQGYMACYFCRRGKVKCSILGQLPPPKRMVVTPSPQQQKRQGTPKKQKRSYTPESRPTQRMIAVVIPSSRKRLPLSLHSPSSPRTASCLSLSAPPSSPKSAPLRVTPPLPPPMFAALSPSSTNIPAPRHCSSSLIDVCCRSSPIESSPGSPFIQMVPVETPLFLGNQKVTFGTCMKLRDALMLAKQRISSE